MFGMGLFEILLIAVIAIIALGPEKLPTAMIEVARFFKKFKSGIDEAKSTLDNELQLSDMKEEASKFRAQIDNVKSTVKLDNLDLGVDDILNDRPKSNFKADVLDQQTVTTTKNEEPKEEIVQPKESSVNKKEENI